MRIIEMLTDMFLDEKRLMGKGILEKLVRQGRTPIHVGRHGTFKDNGKTGNWRPIYLIPPFPENQIDESSNDCGRAEVFTNKNGRKAIGRMLIISYEDAVILEQRIDKEQKRIEERRKPNP